MKPSEARMALMMWCVAGKLPPEPLLSEIKKALEGLPERFLIEADMDFDRAIALAEQKEA